MHELTRSPSTPLPRIHWNREGFKIGLCSTPPVDRPASSPSLLSLSNSCCLADTFAALESRFARLYTRRAMLHHYTQVWPIAQECTKKPHPMDRNLTEHVPTEGLQPPHA